MSLPDPTAFWDAKFADPDYLYGTRPNAFLVAETYRLTPGQSVLMVGDGEGRNGVWLAEQGLKVSSVDASPRAIQKATKLALDRGVALNAACADLRDWAWPVATFDAVVAIFVHFRPDARPVLHRRMAGALKPGGVLILEGFSKAQQGFQKTHGSGGPGDPDMLFSADMLRQDFSELEIVELGETQAVLDEGPGHSGRAALVRLVARR